MHTLRIWDLPTRLFHWLLAACVLGLVLSGSLGGNAMVWHFRFGYAVFSLLLFRIIWGLIGGRWSRFSAFTYTPTSFLEYLRGSRRPEHTAGHNPLGALSVFAMLFFLSLQVAAGLFSDDEIAFAGPLTRLVSSATVSLATTYHKDIGKFILIALVCLHVAAVAFHGWREKENLLRPMLVGDKPLPADANLQPSRDDTASRIVGAIVFAVCTGVVAWVVQAGA